MNARETGERDFAYTRTDFARIRRMLYDQVGIALSEHKFNMVYSRLARRLRQLGLYSVQAYLDRIDAGDEAERQAFINALTTNLTSFFREPHHFDLLDGYLHDYSPTAGPLTIWCCASSTGEEPYSLAMTLVDHFARFDPPARILATDVDTQVLKHAQAGVYALDRVAKLPPDKLKRFFLRGKGGREGYACVRPELKKIVEFGAINLLDSAWAIKEPVDFIFCRNVMIYFDKPTQRKILERFAPLLKPGGLLFAGHSESLHHASDLFRLRGKTVYEVISHRKEG